MSEPDYGELNTIFLSLHWAIEECVAGRITTADLDGTREQIFFSYRKIPWHDSSNPNPGPVGARAEQVRDNHAGPGERDTHSPGSFCGDSRRGTSEGSEAALPVDV